LIRQILDSFVRNSVLANILSITVVFLGVTAATMMVREEMPSVSFDTIRIVVAFPGANPEEVEEGISRKIEEAIKGLEGVKTYLSLSLENQSETIIEIDEAYNGQEVLDRVRIEVESIDTFPATAEKPVISSPVNSEPVMALYINGLASQKSLQEWSYRLKDELMALPEVSQVELYGIKDYQINIEIPEKSLREYGISFAQVAEAIRRSNLNRSSGVIKNETEEIRLRTVGRKYTGSELSSVIVLANRDGNVVTLDKIATIRDGFSEDEIISEVNGTTAILLSIFKTSNEDAIRISGSVREFVDTTQQKLPPGSSIGVMFDNSDSIRHQVDILVKNGIVGLIIVFAILWLFLSARLSLWTGTGILISVMGGLALVWAIGGTINMVSIFGFIMVLGIIADDAIVVGESIAWHRAQGEPPIQAAIDGFIEVGLPVLTAVLTTVIAFVPLMFIDGVMGKFIRILPIIVIACLVISLVESFVILPAHLSHLPDPNRIPKKRHSILTILDWLPSLVSRKLDSFASNSYARFLRLALQWRYVVFNAAIFLLLVSLGLTQGGFLNFELLPQRDGYYLTARVEFPEGTPLSVTQKAIRQLEEGFLSLADKTETSSGEPLVENILTLAGQAPDSEIGEYGAIGSHLGGVQIIMLAAEKRGVHSEKILKQWKEEVGPIYGVKSVSFSGMAMGNPGKPIEIGIDGHDLEEAAAVAEEMKRRLLNYDGVFDVQSDFVKGKNELQFSLKPTARSLGVTVQDLADQLYAGYFGEEVLRIQRGRDNVKIKVRYTLEEKNRLSSLENVLIRTGNGVEVPLNVIASVKTVPGSSAITRVDGLRRVTVTADVDTSVIYPDEIIESLSNGLFKEVSSMHPNIRFVLDGDAGETEESFDTMIVGFILAVLIIYMLIATLFRSYLQPLVILIVIPFGVIGAIWGHFALGYTLTMISMFGMVGLTGIVINDAIVLIECINTNIKNRIPFKEALIQGGTRRFRAVFLTSITTIGGLAPLIIETDSYATTLIPMAITIVFGILFATVLTLVLIPSLLMILNDLRLIYTRGVRGEWMDRLDIEPASNRMGERTNSQTSLVRRSA